MATTKKPELRIGDTIEYSAPPNDPHEGARKKALVVQVIRKEVLLEDEDWPIVLDTGDQVSVKDIIRINGYPKHLYHHEVDLVPGKLSDGAKAAVPATPESKRARVRFADSGTESDDDDPSKTLPPATPEESDPTLRYPPASPGEGTLSSDEKWTEGPKPEGAEGWGKHLDWLVDAFDPKFADSARQKLDFTRWRSTLFPQYA